MSAKLGEEFSMRDTSLEFAGDFFRSAGWRAPICLFLTVGVGLAEGGGLLTLVPFLQVLGLDDPVAATGLSREIRSLIDALGIPFSLGPILACGFGFVLVRALLNYWLTVTQFLLGRDFVLVLQQRLYSALVHASWPALQNSRNSGLIRALTTDVERCGSAAQLLIDLLAAAVLTGVYFSIGAAVSFPLVLLVMATGGTMLFALRFLHQASRRAGANLCHFGAELQHTVEEHLHGIKDARCFGAEERHLSHFMLAAERIRSQFRTVVRGQAIISLCYKVTAAATVALAVFLAVGRFGLPVSEVVLLGALAVRLLGRLSSLHGRLQTLGYLLPSWSSIVGNVEELGNRPDAGRTEKSIEFNREVCFDRVCFAHGDRAILKEVSLKIHRGGMVGIGGSSGAGKTTLVDLLLGLYQPDAGAVLIDGTPLAAKSAAAWRENIGFVGQECHLFDETVRRNLLYAVPDASDEQLWRALELAAADSFVRQLPDSLETTVGSGGRRLSGGERQRLAIARALLRRPALLILDEVTSQLDAENAAKVMDAISRLHGRVTILAISHRPEILAMCDVVHELVEGHLVPRDPLQIEAGSVRQGCRPSDP